MTKDELIKDLEQNVYCRLMPSPRHGVGVFAIKDIPIGVMPFECEEGIPEPFLLVDEAEIFDNPRIPEAVKKMVLDFYVFEKRKVYLFTTGLNSMNISFYLNNSKEPNMEWDDTIENFRASREIKAGEELTVDYDTYSDK